MGVQDRRIQEALLKERNVSLESSIDTCRAAENASLQSKAIRPETVNRVSKSKYARELKPESPRNHARELHERTRKQTKITGPGESSATNSQWTVNSRQMR